MHALLLATVACLGWPAPCLWLGAVAVAGHGLLRWPPPPPGLVLVAEGGACAVPEWRTGLRPLGPRTTVAPFWARLDLGAGARPRELLVLVDQLAPADWRRLNAVLARAHGA